MIRYKPRVSSHPTYQNFVRNPEWNTGEIKSPVVAAHHFGQFPVFKTPALTVQPKLEINSPGDQYEQEADQLADRVMSMSAPLVQRKCSNCGTVRDEYIHRKPLYEQISQLNSPAYGQRKCDKCEEEEDQVLQTKSNSSTQGTASPALASKIAQSKGSGQPLDKDARKFMQARFGTDFGNVRIHSDHGAAEMSQHINAKAFTVGNDIYFNKGQYNSNADTGKRLLAHELTHTVQQSNSNVNRNSILQRSITLTDPAGTPPQPVGAMGPFASKAWTLEDWLDTLCPDGNWEVDNATGVVSSPDRGDFCAAAPIRGASHHTRSSAPTSCECICDLTAPGSRKVEIQIDENLTVGANSIPLVPRGEGATVHTSATDKITALTGRDPVSIVGAGATAPHGGAGRAQILPDPPWVIFGHEVCGHARLQAGVMGATQVGHSTTPEGDLTTVDVENSIRREHSTVASSLGIRAATFAAKDGAGVFHGHQGAVYSVKAGETLSSIASKCGIPLAKMRDHIWRSSGDQITLADQNTIAVNERLLIEGINWHEVIKGETMASIARIWVIPLASLINANPQVIGPAYMIHIGDKLLIPAK